MHIPVYHDINDLHRAAGTGLRAVYDSFFIHRFEDIAPGTALAMPPYRNGFFSIQIFIPRAQTDFTGQVNATAHRVEQALMTFNCPGQILQWKRSGPLSGFCIQFTHEFIHLNGRVRRIIEEFPFFKYNSLTPLALQPAQRVSILNLCGEMLAEQSREEKLCLSVIRGYMDILLYQAKRIYLKAEPVEVITQSVSRRAYEITQDLQELIWRHLSEKKKVEEYARILSITPKHLSEMVKQATGKNASQLIQEALLLESIILLEQTSLTVSEITYALGFDNQSNFAKFFRKHTGNNPIEYRDFRNTYSKTGK
jgi:AraC family transcriptional regulator, transcriptional activator of pobA